MKLYKVVAGARGVSVSFFRNRVISGPVHITEESIFDPLNWDLEDAGDRKVTFRSKNGSVSNTTLTFNDSDVIVSFT